MNIQRNIDKDSFSQRILENGSLKFKADPCPYLVNYSLDVLKKKTKVLDIVNTDKKCLIKNNIESSPHWLILALLYFVLLRLNSNPIDYQVS